MVGDDGDVARSDAGLHRGTDRPCGRHHCAGGDDLAVLRRDDCRSLPGHREDSRGASPRRRARAVLRLDDERVRTVLRGAARLRVVLHAHAGAEQLALVPPDEGSGARVPVDPGSGHDRLDRGRPARRHARARGDGDADATRRRRVVAARAILLRSPPYTADAESPRLDGGRASVSRRWACFANGRSRSSCSARF